MSILVISAQIGVMNTIYILSFPQENLTPARISQYSTVGLRMWVSASLPTYVWLYKPDSKPEVLKFADSSNYLLT